MWINVTQTPHFLQFDIDPGDLVEVVTKDQTTGVINGTWIFEVTRAAPPDAVGRFLEGTSRGCSVTTLAPALDQLFPQSGQGGGVIHFCAFGHAGCPATAVGRQVFHVEQFRRRVLDNVNEPWFVKKDRRKEKDKVQDLKDRLLAQKVKSGSASMQELVAFNLAEKLKMKGARRKKRKRKRKDSSESTSGDEPKTKSQKKKKSTGTDSDSSQSLFSGPLPLEGSRNAIVEQATRRPGSLYTDASLAAASATGARGRGAKETAAYATTGDQWLAYLRTVLTPRYPNGLPENLKKELQTLSVSLSHLARGEVDQLGDTLVQRLKALELGLDGNEPAGSAIQLVDLHRTGLTSHRELEAAQRHQRSELRLVEQQRRLG